MRIAMLSFEWPPFMSGGLAIHCYELTQALASQGVEIDLFVPHGNPASAKWLRLLPTIDRLASTRFIDAYISGASLGSTPSPSGRSHASHVSDLFTRINVFNAQATTAILKEHSTRRYQLIHCHDWLTGKAAIEAAKKAQLPLVATIHSTEWDRTAGIGAWNFIADAEHELVNAADIVITVSERMQRQLVSLYGVDPKKIRVIHNAINASAWQRCSGQNGKRRWSVPIVLFHSRLSIQKGPEFFLKAAARVLEIEPDVHFVVSGGGDMLPRLVELAIDLGIANKVSFLGNVAFEHTQRIYALADVYVLPAPSEPFGLTVLEAMASGVPCVITPTSGVGEVVNACLHAEYWDVDQLATKIVALLRLKPLRSQIIEDARAQIERLSWNDVATKTMQVYRELLSLGNNGLGECS